MTRQSVLWVHHTTYAESWLADEKVLHSFPTPSPPSRSSSVSGAGSVFMNISQNAEHVWTVVKAHYSKDHSSQCFFSNLKVEGQLHRQR